MARRVPDTTAGRRLLAIGAASVLATVILSGCYTGERPRLAEAAELTGDPAADAVLERLDDVGAATFTANYTTLTRLGDITSSAVVVQEGDSRRSITIGDVRFLVEGSSTATCDMAATAPCPDGIRPEAVSDLQLGPEFYARAAAARLRTDVERRVGTTVASTETIAGQRATCVVVPFSDASTTYCALDSGVLARLDGADVTVELTGYGPTVDELQFQRPG